MIKGAFLFWHKVSEASAGSNSAQPNCPSRKLPESGLIRSIALHRRLYVRSTSEFVDGAPAEIVAFGKDLIKRRTPEPLLLSTLLEVAANPRKAKRGKTLNKHAL